MKIKNTWVLVLVGTLAACGSGGGNTSNPDSGNKCAAAMYPCGPFGTMTGDTIANLQFVGKRDHNGNGSLGDETMEPITLADYFKNKNIKALAILGSAEWCTPCQAEQPELVALWNDYKKAGGGIAILELVVQNKDNSPGNLDTLDRWAARFGIPFDMAADPNMALGPYYNLAAFPMEMVIRASDMSISAQNNGYVQGWLKQQLDPLLK